MVHSVESLLIQGDKAYFRFIHLNEHEHIPHEKDAVEDGTHWNAIRLKWLNNLA